jgi:hypothetical protein
MSGERIAHRSILPHFAARVARANAWNQFMARPNQALFERLGAAKTQHLRAARRSRLAGDAAQARSWSRSLRIA